MPNDTMVSVEAYGLEGNVFPIEKRFIRVGSVSECVG